MAIDDKRVTDILLKIPGFFETYRKKTFTAARHRKDGGEEMVTIEVTDGGPSAEDTRFSCVATSAGGKVCSGNSASTIEQALATVHWWELDKVGTAGSDHESHEKA